MGGPAEPLAGLDGDEAALAAAAPRGMGERRRFLLFVGIGAFAAGVNLVARLVLNLVMPYEAAILVGYPFGMTTAFLLNRTFLFEGSALGWHVQYARFALVNVVALGQIFLVSVLLDRLLLPWIGWTWHADTVAHAVGLASPIVTSYWAHKHFSFARAGAA